MKTQKILKYLLVRLKIYKNEFIEIQVTPYEENKSVFSQSRATSNHREYLNYDFIESFTEFNTIEHHFDEDDQYSNNLNPYYKVN